MSAAPLYHVWPAEESRGEPHRQSTMMARLFGKARKSLDLVTFDGQCKACLSAIRQVVVDPSRELAILDVRHAA